MKAIPFFSGAFLAVALLVTGCGTVDTRLTSEQLTNARIAVAAAEKADAKNFDADNLRHAQDMLAIANDSYANNSFQRAFDFAKKATIYAQVALARTEQRKEELKVADKRKELEKITAQIDAYMNPVHAAPIQNTPAARPIAATPQSVPTITPQVPAPENGKQP